MTESRNCSRCGAALPTNTPGGHCLPCLLQLGLQSGATSDKAVAAGIQPGGKGSDDGQAHGDSQAVPGGRMPSSRAGGTPAATLSPGRPYFVMELVRGVKITTYCDQQKLPTRQRLDLFIQVCQAVQHAHQKGIIHREIKPSNVLVTEQDGAPMPKIIDFGIAKATTDQRLTDKTLFTTFEQFIGTPACMSPEQAGLG